MLVVVVLIVYIPNLTVNRSSSIYEGLTLVYV